MTTNLSTVLYIFTTSDVPDVYINSIGYCIEHYPKVEKILLLSIIKDKGLKPRTMEQLDRIRSNIEQQLSLLQSKKYLYKNQETKQWDRKEIEIEEYDRRRYASFASHDIDIKVIFYDELELVLSEFLLNSKQKCIFDVSAVLKGYLVDVYTVLFEKGAENIHAFELKKVKRSYDEQELIHNLALDKGDYEYVNLAKSAYTLGKGILNHAQLDKYKKIEERVDRIIDMWSIGFAKWVLGIYFALVVASLIFLVLLVVAGIWERFDPLVTIIFGTPLITYVLALFMQIVFSKKISLEPDNLSDWLKEYKVKQITKKL